MANTKWFDGLGDATQDVTTFYGSILGTVTADTTVFHQTNGGAGCSTKCDTGAGNANAAFNNKAANSILADAGRRISVWVRFSDVSPTSNTDIIRLIDNAGAGILSFDLTTAGKLHTAITGGGTSALTFVVNTWYRITISYTITSTTVNTFKVYITSVDGASGALQYTDTNVTLPRTGSDRLLFLTGTTFGASKQIWFDDVYVDDGADLLDPGDIRTTAKLPTTTNANNYNTTIGTGAVNERPLSITNGMEDTQVGGGIIQNYAIETVSGGDVNISTYTQIAFMGWMWAKEGSVSGTPQLTVNGVDTAVTLTTSAALYLAITDSATYPANAATIGQKSGTSASGTFLYECGIQIAFLWSAATTAPDEEQGLTYVTRTNW